MRTTHSILRDDARDLSRIPSSSVQLIVTSPPYPMIAMWDEMFSSNSHDIRDALRAETGDLAFELMHKELDKVWQEVFRVLENGCYACINVGDATRTIGDRFQLYSNHSRITSACKHIGFDVLPVILWKKTTNAPNKFMGSGMLPAGAYVTLEHEYILIFRKGGKRIFDSPEKKQARNESAFFWEERNKWFSDSWDLKGVSQTITESKSRERSAAYPFELAYRLVNMYSLYGDTVLDPFVGTGTTSVAALATGRNSIGVEVDSHLHPRIARSIMSATSTANSRLEERIRSHMSFLEDYGRRNGDLKHRSACYGFPVVTKQETQIQFYSVKSITETAENSSYGAEYAPLPRMNSDFTSAQVGESV